MPHLHRSARTAFVSVGLTLHFGCATFTLQHSGGTDSQGCHTDSRTGSYHCHNGGNGEDVDVGLLVLAAVLLVVALGLILWMTPSREDYQPRIAGPKHEQNPRDWDRDDRAPMVAKAKTEEAKIVSIGVQLKPSSTGGVVVAESTDKRFRIGDVVTEVDFVGRRLKEPTWQQIVEYTGGLENSDPIYIHLRRGDADAKMARVLGMEFRAMMGAEETMIILEE